MADPTWQETKPIESAPPKWEETHPVSAENPIESDLWAGPGGDQKESMSRRMAASFGNPAGITAQLKKLGYQDAKVNGNGEVVAKSQDGHWYKDKSGGMPEDYGSAEGLLGAPARAIAHHLGGSLPGIGMMAGGAGGGLALGPGGAIAGAGVLGGAGEKLREVVGKHMGYYQDPQNLPITPDVGNEAISSALMEGAGQTLPLGMDALGGAAKQVGKAISETPYVGPAYDLAAKGVNKALSGANSLISTPISALTGVDMPAVKNMISRPWKTQRPLPSSQIDDLAEKQILECVSIIKKTLLAFN